MLTHYDTLSLQDVVEIGDILLLPEPSRLPLEEARALMVAGVISEKESVIHQAAFDVIAISEKYCHERLGVGKEPEWIREYPPSVRTYVRTMYAQTQEDALAIVGPLPYSGINYMVREGGLAEQASWTFKLHRLRYIKQLGFLNAPPFNNFLHARQSLSEHSRYLHSLDVYAVGSLIAHNLGLKGRDMHTVQTLLITHDALSPAGGDSVKDVDPKGLDEDINYGWLLDRVDFKSFAKRFGVRRKDLEIGVLNQGLFGEILDVADKLAYVGRDIWACKHHMEAGVANDQYGVHSLLELIQRFPHVCSVWDCVEQQRGRLVCTDVRRLAAFLKVRLLMFRELYYHPVARFGEFLMSRLFVRTLFKSGELTRDMLFEMTDSDLLTMLDKRFGSGYALDTLTSDLSRCATFKTVEEGRAFMDELRRSGNVFAMMDDNRRAIKTGLDFLIKTNGGPVALREFDPGLSRELTEMATMLKMVHVYYLDGDPPLSRSTLKEIRDAIPL